MTCREVVRLLGDYLDGALGESDRRRLEQHLAVCTACSEYLEQLRTTGRLLGRLAVEEVPPELQKELVRAFRNWRSK